MKENRVPFGFAYLAFAGCAVMLTATDAQEITHASRPKQVVKESDRGRFLD